MDLSIIIINWKSKDFLQKCLKSLYADTDPIPFEVLVVDNASFDGSAEMLASQFPQVRFFQSKDNLGFSRANNFAAAQADGDVFLFLNPDTEVQPGAIKRLYQAMLSLPEAGLVGAKLLNTNGTVQTSCLQSYPTILNQLLDSDFLRNKSRLSPLWGMAPLFSSSPTPVQVEAIVGACVMLKKNVFEKIGCFSDDYFMYGEDIDLCFKVSLAGYRNYYVPTSVVTHHGGQSSKQRPSTFPVVTMRQSVWLFFRKFRGGHYAAGYRVAMGLGAMVRLGLLICVCPLVIVTRFREGMINASRKWLAIVGWSLRLKS